MQSALLVIDMQEGFRLPRSEEIILPIQNFLNSFSGEVVFTQFFDTPKSLFETQLHWPIFQDKQKQEILVELRENAQNIFRHSTYNPITEELKDFLKEKGVTRIYLCGVYTDVSVFISATTLFDLGFDVYVLKEACASLHPEERRDIHQSSLESLSYVLGSDHLI